MVTMEDATAAIAQITRDTGTVVITPWFLLAGVALGMLILGVRAKRGAAWHRGSIMVMTLVGLILLTSVVQGVRTQGELVRLHEAMMTSSCSVALAGVAEGSIRVLPQKEARDLTVSCGHEPFLRAVNSPSSLVGRIPPA